MKDWRRREIDPRVIPGGTILVGDRMATFKRLYRWANLTIIQQGIWPLLVIITSATATDVEWTPFPWFWARLAAPVVAAVAAYAYLRQPLPLTALVRNIDDPVGIELLSQAGEPPASMLARQVRFFLLGMPILLGIVILLTEPLAPAGKLMAFGAAQVAAYHLINFYVVPSSYANRARGLALGTLLFALSWGIFDLLNVAIGNDDASLVLAFAGGVVLGGIVALVSRLLMQWPGGKLTAPATHWLVIYLIFGVLA